MEVPFKGFVIWGPGEDFTSFNKDNSANFYGEKRYNEAFLGVNVLRIRAKTLSQILSSWSFWSSNLKVSNMAAVTSCENSSAIVMII